jgi:uncharacterized membrane protein YdjX (TVP38/TMEM64 family)
VVIRVAFGAYLEPRTLVEALQRLGHSAWAMPVLGLAYVVGTTLLFPAIAFHVTAGAAFGFVPGVIFSFALSNGTSHLHFAVGRLLARDAVRGWMERRGLKWVVEELEVSGMFSMMVLRQLPLPFVGVNAGAGASPMPWWHFAVGNALGLIPSAIVYPYFAAELVEGVQGAGNQAFSHAALAGACIIALALGSRALQRWWRRRGRVEGKGAP